MFVLVLFNTEYMDITMRKVWYLKNLFHCKENGWILITHEYMRTHFLELQESITPRFFDQFEMIPFKIEELSNVEQYFVDDDVFDSLESLYGTRTETLTYLFSQRYDKLENRLFEIFEMIQLKHPKEKIEGIFNSLDAFESLRYVAKKLKFPIVNYSFSAFRKPHGYRQTLYTATSNGYYWDANDSALRYANYLSEQCAKIPVFSNTELIAIFGKERTLPLIQLISFIPKYEMGICCECFSLAPQVFSDYQITDDDIFYECKKLYSKDQMFVRSHAAHLDDIQVDRDEVHNDPASYILSCKRVSSVLSQIILKVLLWKRTAIMRKTTNTLSFLCESDYSSLRTVNLCALNYYIFCYLIPNDLMFSDEYWKWRLTNPKECEIYKRHLDFYIEKLNLPNSILTEKDESIRFKSILQSRGCDEELINILLADKHDFDIDYNTASSRIVVNGKSYWRLNKLENSQLHFHIELNDSTDSIDFYPLDDVAGFSQIISVKVNGTELPLSLKDSDYRYMKKVMGHYSFPIVNNNRGALHIEIVWQYKKVFDYLNEKS